MECLDETLVHIQRQVEKGRKFMPGESDLSYKAKLSFYINEIILGNNSIIVDLDGAKTTYINHIVLKYISTSDKKFTTKTYKNFQNLVSRSNLISETGEKERTKFFKSLRERVQACKSI